MRYGFIILMSVLELALPIRGKGASADHYEVAIEHSVPVKMRDGVLLRADIYRPKAEGKFPVLLQRTPYDKRGELDFGLNAAARGYVVVIQDVRGRYSSDGEWYPFKYESQDGYDTVEWAAALPYSNGKVGMFGGSYVGATQMLAAIAAPPHLAGIFPVVTAANYHDGWTYQGGAFEQWFSESWTSGLAMDTLDRRIRESTNAMEWNTRLPLVTYPILDFGGTEKLAVYFQDWLAHPRYDDYWKRWSIEDQYDRVRVPAYHVGGWYDIFLGGTLRNYAGIKGRGGNDRARRSQRLLVGPWYHGPFSGRTGDLDFGPSAKLDTDELLLRWYDYLLKGVRNDLAGQKPIRIFVMGRNAWRDEDDWPPARARTTRYYLHSGGKANSLTGNGTLDAELPGNETPDGFTYDPLEPVPTRGGPLCCDNVHLASGVFDQRLIEAREDVLVYTTEELRQDLEVTGPVSVELYASSSAIDTDFTAKLVDVWPNGYAQNLTEGILRTRYRNSPERVEFMNPGETYLLHIDLWATSNVFLKGHKVRLEVSSSNFPRFDHNMNTGEDAAFAVHWVKASQKVYHDLEHPSALVLSVVPQ